MKKLDLIGICLALTSVSYVPATFAENGGAGNSWAPAYPSNNYWQAPPPYSGFNRPPAGNQSAPVPPQNQPYQSNPPQSNPYQGRPYQDMSYQNRPPARPAPPVDSYTYQGRPSTAAPYRSPQQGNVPPRAPEARPPANYGAYPPPPRGPYNGSAYGPDNGASAFYTPGYNQYRDGRRSNNKFWGRSGPSRWMNPNKGNMEQGWDDMMNAPSRMGTMPGGWNAPEVSMPNPVDMADQVQDNVQDLPQQIRDMDVGNE